MRVIYTYEVKMADEFQLELPINSEVLSCQVQNDIPNLWILHPDSDAEKEFRTFRVIGTGHPIDVDEKLQFIDTFQLAEGGLIFHIFERKL